MWKNIVFGTLLVSFAVFAELTVAGPLTFTSSSNGTIDCKDLNQTDCCNENHCTYLQCKAADPVCVTTLNITDEMCATEDRKDLCDTLTTTVSTGTDNGTDVMTGTQEPTTQPAMTTSNETDLSTTQTPEETTENNEPTEAPTTQGGGATDNTSEPTSPSNAPTSSPLPTSNGTVPTTPGGQCEEHQGQQFDAASFIGGIVLCGGMVAIVFFSIKFYRSRSENRYHQF